MLSGLVPLGESLAGEVHELVALVPVRLEEVVGILLRHMVIAQQTLGVEAFLATGIAVRREVEHVPDEACSDIRAVLNIIPVRFQQVGLIFLIVLIAIGIRSTIPRERTVHFRMLVDIGTGTIFGKHHGIGTKNLLIVVHLIGQRFHELLVPSSICIPHWTLEADIKVHASKINLGTPLCGGVDRIGTIDVCLHDQAIGIFLMSQINKRRVKCNKLVFGYFEIRSITCELLAITNLVLYTPHNDRRIVVPLTDHLCELVRNRVLVGIRLRINQVVRNLAIYQQTLFIGHLVEGRIVRIMRRTNGVHAHIKHGVDILSHLITGNGIAHTFTVLVVAHAMDFDLFTVQVCLTVGNLERTETNLRALCVQHMTGGILQGDVHRIQVGVSPSVPTVNVGELLVQLLLCGFSSSTNLDIRALFTHNISGIIRNSRFQDKVCSFRGLVGNVYSRVYGRIVAVKLVIHKDARAALVLGGNVLVGQRNELNITVDARELRVIDVNRDGNRIDIGHVNGESNGVLVLHILGQIEDKSRVTTDMGAHFLTIDLHRSVLVRAIELDE